MNFELLGICFWRKGREERNWVEFMGEKGGSNLRGGAHLTRPLSISKEMPIDQRDPFRQPGIQEE